MALSSERANQIAMLYLQFKSEKEGIILKPSETKREISNSAKQLKISSREAAEVAKIIYAKAFEKVMAELDEVINTPDKVEK